MRGRDGGAAATGFPGERTCCVARRLCYILAIGEEYTETTLRRDCLVAQMRRGRGLTFHSRGGGLVLLAHFPLAWVTWRFCSPP